MDGVPWDICNGTMLNPAIGRATDRYRVIKGAKGTLIAQISGELLHIPWWRHQMETFSALLALCVGNSSVTVNSPHRGQWREALMFSLTCALNNERLNKQSWGWWFESTLHSLWRHCHAKISIADEDFKNQCLIAESFPCLLMDGTVMC